MEKPKLIIEECFEEDIEPASEFFDIERINYADWVNKTPEGLGRVSCNTAAAREKKDYQWLDCSVWTPYLRKWMIQDDPWFAPVGCLMEYGFKNMGGRPLFIKSSAPFKEFTGGVFTEEEFRKEAEFCLKHNYCDISTMCMVCQEEKEIHNEWRVIFYNNEIVGASQYMQKIDGELQNIEKQGAPIAVLDLAKEISESELFLNKFDFTIDIAWVSNGNNIGYKLVEPNGFWTSGFYAADRRKIFSAVKKGLTAT